MNITDQINELLNARDEETANGHTERVALRIALRRMLENDYCRMRKNAKALADILNALKGA